MLGSGGARRREDRAARRRAAAAAAPLPCPRRPYGVRGWFPGCRGRFPRSSSPQPTAWGGGGKTSGWPQAAPVRLQPRAGRGELRGSRRLRPGRRSQVAAGAGAGSHRGREGKASPGSVPQALPAPLSLPRAGAAAGCPPALPARSARRVARPSSYL